MAVRVTPPQRAPLRLSVLPNFTLLAEGVRLDLCPLSQRLVGFLALQGGRPLARSVVSGTLRPETSDAKAHASLRTAIWRLHQDAGTTLVGASTTHVWLEPSIDVDLPAATARAHALHGLESLGPGDVDVGRDLAYLSHDVLEDWYDDWVFDERERFRQLRLHVLDRLGELLLCAGRPAEAVQVGLVAVAAETLRESAQRLLVKAHLAEGNVAEALRQYRTYAALAADELGIRPSVAMETLVDEALARAARPAWSLRTRAGAPALP